MYCNYVRTVTSSIGDSALMMLRRWQKRVYGL